jgi:hypothetical protein
MAGEAAHDAAGTSMMCAPERTPARDAVVQPPGPTATPTAVLQSKMRSAGLGEHVYLVHPVDFSAVDT